MTQFNAWIKKYGTIVLVVALIVLFIAWYSNRSKKRAQGGDLASCLKNSGAKMYGSAHCGYCNQQKAMLRNSPDIPYVECLDKDGRSTQECFDLKITGYPTWIFKNGKRITGFATLEQLKENAGC